MNLVIPVIVIMGLVSFVTIPTVIGDHSSDIMYDLGLSVYDSSYGCGPTAGHCVRTLSQDYQTLTDAYTILHHNHTEQTRTIEHLQDEVNVWQSKYNHLLLSQGAPDQIENLTNRVVSLENQTAVNEGYVFQLRSVVKSLQADVADIYLKINSVR